MEILAKLQDAVTIFMGIILGALPFILFGVLVSAFLAHYIKEEKLLRIIPKNPFLAVLVGCLIGFLFPVCECGNVPVARRLIKKGVPVYVAITFLLAAPVINPITFFSTWAAFSFLPEVVLWRIGLTLLIAAVIGYIFSLHPDQKKLLNLEKMGDMCCDSEGHCHAEPHTHNHKGELDNYHVKYSANRFWSFIRAIPEEFFEMLAALVFGAVLASLIQVFVPRETILAVGQGPFLSIISMLVFAVVISVCSSVDAFIALSYAGTFTTGSLLAFLVFGPMIDLKSIWMLRTIFTWKTIVQIIASALLMTVLFTTIYNFYLG
jgi:uncharacterized membrane protein YraQ (UPF0718 family)